MNDGEVIDGVLDCGRVIIGSRIDGEISGIFSRNLMDNRLILVERLRLLATVALAEWYPLSFGGMYGLG